MKLKKLLCCILSTVFAAVPIISGCSSSDSSVSLFDLAGQQISSQSVSSVPSQTESLPGPAESSYLPEPSVPQPSQPPVSVPQPAGSEITPALWKAENSAGNSVYLMGSLHMGDDAVNYMPDYINNAFNECTALAVEADIDSILADQTKLQALAPKIVYSDGTTIKDHISETTYNGVVELLKNSNAYQQVYDYYTIFMWQSIVPSVIPVATTLNIQNGVDLTMLKRAKNDGKQILEVESIEFQIDMFNSFSDGLSDAILAEYLNPNYGQAMSVYLSQLYTMWKNGTVDESLVLTGTFLDPNSVNYEYVQEYYNKLLKERNIGMARTIEGYIDGGQKVFVLVGAFHYVGQDGIISLLQRDGYTVSRVI